MQKISESALDERRERLAGRLRTVVDGPHVLGTQQELAPYECDGLAAYRVVPLLVVLPGSIDEVQAVLRICNEERIPVVARGAGTGLSGGALPNEHGVLLSLARLNRILEIDPDNSSARVQPGVRNLAISEAAGRTGSTTPPTRRRRSPARSAATSPKTPAACTA